MYAANPSRYDTAVYRRCGRSGLKLPAVSLGLWHNFGSTGCFDTMRDMCRTAFDAGITHFDLANNYGPEAGSAETNFGRILREDLLPYRDELIENIRKYAGWIAPLIVYGGDFEMEALASGAIRALDGVEETKEYTGVPVWNGFPFEYKD